MLRLSTLVLTVVLIGSVAFIVRASASVTPQDADVDKNGAVSIADAIDVMPHIGTLEQRLSVRMIFGNRGYSAFSGTTALVSTDDFSIIAEFPCWSFPDASISSCDGRYSMMFMITASSNFQFIDNMTGAVAVRDTTTGVP